MSECILAIATKTLWTENHISPKITGQGRWNCPIPKHEQPVRRSPMSERDSICASKEKPAVEYRDVLGWPGCRVGSDGTVWSNRSSRGGEWKPRKPTVDKNGYLYIDYKSHGQRQRKYVHTLILETFVGPKPDGCESLHGPDFNPQNNSVANLRWGTRAENIQEAVSSGRWCKDRGCRGSKLVPAEVVAIRELCVRHPGKSGIQAFLSRWFGISTGIISEIHTRKRWAQV